MITTYMTDVTRADLPVLGRALRCACCGALVAMSGAANHDDAVFCTDCLESALDGVPIEELGGEA
jgi:hypothetical protein